MGLITLNNNTTPPYSSMLYIVSTPIGNLDDITLRALSVLKSVDLIAAEDTRHTGLLLQHYSINNKLFSLHNHNEQQKTEALISKLKNGVSIALVSDAGTPLINDPGYHLVHRCIAENIRVVPIPGACAAIAALSISGLPSDRFCYEGFLPAKKKARCDLLQKLAQEERTLIFYESTHRLLDSLEDIINQLGKDRHIVLARELTKTWETVTSMSAEALLLWLQEDDHRKKGEMVLVIEGYKKNDSHLISLDVTKVLLLLQQELPLKKAAAITAEIYGINKNQLYKLGLKQK